jgi:hypothetical protein
MRTLTRLLVVVCAAGLVFLAGGQSSARADKNCGGEEQLPCPLPEGEKPPQLPKLDFRLGVDVTGQGTVAGHGINCGEDCSESFPEHTVVVLVPIPAAGSTFVGWSGDCTGTGLCVVTVDGDRSVHAAFAPGQPPDPEIGPPTDKIDDKGVVGGSTDLTFGFECYAPEETFLVSLFEDVLHRPIDQASLDAYFPRLHDGMISATDAALALLEGAEYRTQLIQSFYMRFLHRMPTSTELAAAFTLFAGGATDEDVAASILGSDEYYATRGGGTNVGFIAALYQDILGRDPTLAEQVQLDAAFGHGLTRTEAALQVLRSVEARSRLIQSYFQAFLHRAPTDLELNFFLARFAAGATDEQVAAEILGSTEYSDNLDDYGGNVNWGDGTETDVHITHTGDEGKICVLTAGHRFDDPGTEPVTVEVTAPDGTTETFTGFLHIFLAPPPPPGKENVQPFGDVLINVNGTFVPLTRFQQVKIGTELDTTHGRVRLTSHDGSFGFFFQGRFKILQLFVTVNGHKKLVTLLLLTGGADCGARTTAGVGVTPTKHKPIRHLWGSAKGSFRTKGKYASATVRGTLWETFDYCDGTLVLVKNGTVDVFDLVRQLHHFVTGGHSFFAPAP